ncbi:MAG TPA: transposase [Limnochordia bacterium]|nr:transposase [Limnochordia bacterium]
MPRKRRLWYPGAMYHITCRGNHRQDIFRDAMDRNVYLSQLLQAKEDHSCTILAYCLMTNHVHLQVETSHIELWHMMKQLNMRYVLYFNRKYDLVGHLFQGRYRAELIKDLGSCVPVSRYIHLNPVVAGMSKTPAAYPWSSYSNFLGKRLDGLASPDRILDLFPQPSVEQYRAYVEQIGGNVGCKGSRNKGAI